MTLYEKKEKVGENVSFYTSVTADGVNMGYNYDSQTITMNAGNGSIHSRYHYLGARMVSRMDPNESVLLGYASGDASTPPRFQIESYKGRMPTYSGAANTRITSNGAIYQIGSMKSLKQDITHDFSVEKSHQLIDLKPAQWFDKAEVARYENGDEDDRLPRRYIGLIAEEVEQAGLEDLVEHNDDGEVTSIAYDRVAIALLPALSNMREELAELKFKMEKILEEDNE